jgi:hypothetical protein
MGHRAAAAFAAACALGVGACGSDQDDRPDYRLITPPRYAGAPPVATPPSGGAQDASAADARRLRPVIAAWARRAGSGGASGRARGGPDDVRLTSGSRGRG